MSFFEEESVREEIKKLKEAMSPLLKMRIAFISENNPHPMSLVEAFIEHKRSIVELQTQLITITTLLEILIEENQSKSSMENPKLDFGESFCKLMEEKIKDIKEAIKKSDIVKNNGLFIPPGLK